jgi:60 kDa SS-A/Ro ribonucleoprotein
MAFLRKQRASSAAVAQTVPLNSRQVQNEAGGYVFQVSDWDALDRFLILGTAGGTFYVNQETMTDRATELIQRCLKADGPRVVEMLTRVSDKALAIKQDYAIYALALALAGDDVPTRVAAYRVIDQVCRTGSTLMQLLSYLRGRRGWSRGLRNAVAFWYDGKAIDQVAYQMVKYRSRNDFTQRDILRLAHPNEHQALYAWAAGKAHDVDKLPQIVRDYEAAAKAESVDLELAARLPREALPTEWLNEPGVWSTMLHAGMPMNALIRNLGNLGKHNVLVAGSESAAYVVSRLTDSQQIQKSRVHPISIYLAASTYNSGRSVKGSGTWAPVGAVSNALDDAFRLAFQNVEPTGKRVLVAVDVSGSMTMAQVENTMLTAANVSTAMAFVTALTEPKSEIIGFDWNPGRGRYTHPLYATRAAASPTGVYEYKVAGDERLRDFQARFANPGGGTDLALPFEWALNKGRDFDAVVIFTDGETWAGDQHAVQALEAYRKHVGHKVKVVVAATTATGHSIGDPTDRDVLQVAGFSADVPLVVNDFLRR